MTRLQIQMERYPRWWVGALGAGGDTQHPAAAHGASHARLARRAFKLLLVL